MEIHADFWPGQRLSKKLFERRGLYVSFSTAGLHPGSWINRLSVSREKFHVTIYVEKARVLRSNLTMFRPCYVWKYYEWFWEVLWLPRKSFIVWFTESVDRQISGMCGWARVTRILCAKHKNASWVCGSGTATLTLLNSVYSKYPKKFIYTHSWLIPLTFLTNTWFRSDEQSRNVMIWCDNAVTKTEMSRMILLQ